jgi:hypothetical protein
MSKDVIREGDDRWESLFKAWLASSGDAGWLVYGGKQYRVFAQDDDTVVFENVSGNIDSMYGSLSGGI